MKNARSCFVWISRILRYSRERSHHLFLWNGFGNTKILIKGYFTIEYLENVYPKIGKGLWDFLLDILIMSMMVLKLDINSFFFFFSYFLSFLWFPPSMRIFFEYSPQNRQLIKSRIKVQHPKFDFFFSIFFFCHLWIDSHPFILCEYIHSQRLSNLIFLDP